MLPDRKPGTRLFPRGRAGLACIVSMVILVVPAIAPSMGSAHAADTVAPDLAALEAELRATESAFARSMAVRDHAAFVSHLADETVFLGSRAILRGRDAVADSWKRFFEGPDAPFAWAPEEVAVLDSGTLGLTSGPVHDPEGNRIGTFNSIWRRENGRWTIIFDKGCPPCGQ